MRVLTRISDQACIGLMERAAPLLGGLAVSALRGARSEVEQAVGGGQALLVHDLMPDPVVQLEWLHRLHQRFPRLSFFLLLPPGGDVVHELAHRGSRLPLLGIEPWTPGLSPDALARRLRSALDGRADALRLWERVAHWPLPPSLRFLAEAELRFAPRDASLDRVLRLAEVSYESARRAARRAGLPPPRGFVEPLRLLRVVSALERNQKVKRAAPAYGFHDTKRLERRMHHHFGLTPSDAGKIGALALLDRLEQQWFGDVVAH